MQENKILAGNVEQILLSKKNCHRALKVVNIAKPEQGEWLFNWRGKKLSDNLMRCILQSVFPIMRRLLLMTKT